MKRMVKTVAAFILAGAMVVGFIAVTNTTALANELSRFGGCCVGGGMGRQLGGMMWDEDGNFLTREAFEERLDNWIAEGFINSQDRTFMLERFDWCFSYGGGATGVRGQCGGFGGGRGRHATRWS
ncbi:MAG: hypothetical protein FWE05_07690 [Defluviitaleaceae bacterium]|nr:hypothetical protein [Defluviitaleaceae bacterium]